jgi:lysyl-tRNA synthetase class 2
LPQYQSPFEEKLYNERRAKIEQIAAIGERLGLSPAESIYPNNFAFTHTFAKSADEIPALLPLGLDATGEPLSAEALEAAPIEAAIAGRIMAIRVQGKAGFATLQQDGRRIQIYVRKDDIGASPEQSEDLFALYKLLDLGDHIGVRGHLMRTRTGELTLKAAPIHLPGHEGQPALAFLAKAMLALPDKYSGLEDTELRYRQRYLDLVMNSGTRAEPAAPSSTIPTNLSSRPQSSQFHREDAAERSAAQPAPSTQPEASTIDTIPNVRATFVKRAAILRSIRKFFDARGYLEVETPMLHTIAGGAAARPFKTHHNALDIPLSLRIAPELYLKRLVVGGLDRVYEINRNFRNEGVSTQHNPEFTMLEFYQAYANYHDLMDLTQELITTVAQEVNGTTITNFNGHDIDLAKTNWTKLSMRAAFQKFWEKDWAEYFGPAPESFTREGMITFFGRVQLKAEKMQDDVDAFDAETVEKARLLLLLFRGIFQKIADEDQWGKAIAVVFELVSEKYLIDPHIIYDFPLAVSPLSKIKPDEPDWVERFEFYIGGFEVGNAFSELNDPDDQRRRFEAQLEDRKRGDDEAMAEVDEDYVRALGYGLPPTAGEGIGIDRLTMILTGSRSIRDVILFPLMRPHKPTASEASDPGE